MPGKVGKKVSIKNRVDSGIPIGILGYYENQPIAWCSIAPRESYRSLGGDEALEDVWSLVRFSFSVHLETEGYPASFCKLP